MIIKTPAPVKKKIAKILKRVDVIKLRNKLDKIPKLENMRIDFKALIQEWNEKHPGDKLTRAKLAREMVTRGDFTSEVSALNMMRYHEQGRGKSVDDLLFRFISEKFGKTYEEIVIR